MCSKRERKGEAFFLINFVVAKHSNHRVLDTACLIETDDTQQITIHPFYHRDMGYGLLKGKRGIVFGALNEQSIAWKAAERCYEEGASLVLSNTEVAIRMGTLNDLAEKTGAHVIAADATCSDDLEAVFKGAEEKLGGKIDFVLHSIGMSPNVRKSVPYESLNYGFLSKTLDISAISFHKMLAAAHKLDALAEGASVVALTYIAAERATIGYSDMADAKALLQSIARSFGLIYGKEKKVRINTVSQSPTMTTAGSGVSGMTRLLRVAEDLSPLGNANADECADYIVTLFSDLTKKVTMQNLYHDGGFSSTGMSLEALDKFDPEGKTEA